MGNTKRLRGMDELIKRLNLGVISAMEVETLELDEGDAFLGDIQHLKTTTTKLINDLVDAIGVVTDDVVMEYLKNANLYLRSAEKNLGGVIASGEDLQEQTENLKDNLIKGFASYVLFAMANSAGEVNELTSKRLEANEEDLQTITDLLDELDSIDNDINLSEKYGNLSYYKDLGYTLDYSDLKSEFDDFGEEDEVIDTDVDVESKLKWDTDDNLDLDMFTEKRD